MHLKYIQKNQNLDLNKFLNRIFAISRRIYGVKVCVAFDHDFDDQITEMLNKDSKEILENTILLDFRSKNL